MSNPSSPRIPDLRHPQTDDIADQSLVWNDQDQMVPKTYALIVIGGLIGMTEISENSYVEFYKRFLIYQKCAGDIWNGPEITMFDVRLRVGMHITCLPMSAQKFRNHVWALMSDDMNKLMQLEERAVFNELARRAGQAQQFPPGKLTETPPPTSRTRLTLAGKRALIDAGGNPEEAGTFIPNADAESNENADEHGR